MKNFFDEATGVKQYQIKREQAQNKIKATEENLGKIKSLIREMRPRVKNLEEQIEKQLAEETDAEDVLEKPGIFRRIWAWFKGLFS